MKSSKSLKGKVRAIRILIVAIGIIALITVIWTFVNISNKRTEEVFNTVIEDLLEKNHRNGMEEILNNMDTMIHQTNLRKANGVNCILKI